MKTEHTREQYRIRAAQLIKRAGQAIDSNHPTLSEVARWLVENQYVMARSTWRQYRAAMRCYLEGYEAENALQLIDREAAIALLRATDTSQCSPSGTNTSAKKQKKIPEKDLETLADYFLANPGIRHGTATFYWLVSGLWTGLRPSEWQSARLIDDADGNCALIVSNAKNTNGRSHGDDRIIHLNNISELELTVIRLHLTNIATAKNNDIRFTAVYKHCRDCLYAANKKLWPKRHKFISLYSARHQFAADAKKSGLSQSAIAALMGHASEDTAGIHYGRRVSGRGGFRVAANAADVARVQAINVRRLERKVGDSPHM